MPKISKKEVKNLLITMYYQKKLSDHSLSQGQHQAAESWLAWSKRNASSFTHGVSAVTGILSLIFPSSKSLNTISHGAWGAGSAIDVYQSLHEKPNVVSSETLLNELFIPELTTAEIAKTLLLNSPDAEKIIQYLWDEDDKEKPSKKDVEKLFTDSIAKIENTFTVIKSAIPIGAFLIEYLSDDPKEAENFIVGMTTVVDVGYTAAMFAANYAATGGLFGVVTLGATVLSSIKNFLSHFMGNANDQENYLEKISDQLKKIEQTLRDGLNYLAKNQQIIINGLLNIQKLLANVTTNLEEIKWQLNTLELHLVDKHVEQERKKSRDELLGNIVKFDLLLKGDKFSPDFSFHCNNFLVDIFKHAQKSSDVVFSGSTEISFPAEILIKEIKRNSDLQYSFGLLPQLLQQLDVAFPQEYSALVNPFEWAITVASFLYFQKICSDIYKADYSMMTTELIRMGKAVQEFLKLFSSQEVFKKIIKAKKTLEKNICEKTKKSFLEKIELFNLQYFPSDFFLVNGDKVFERGYVEPVIQIENVDLGNGKNGTKLEFGTDVDRKKSEEAVLKIKNTTNSKFIACRQMVVKDGESKGWRFSYLPVASYNPIAEAERIGLIQIIEEEFQGGGIDPRRKICLFEFCKGPLEGFKFAIYKHVYLSEVGQPFYYDDHSSISGHVGKNAFGKKHKYSDWRAEILKIKQDINIFLPKDLTKQKIMREISLFDFMHYQLNNFVRYLKETFVTDAIAEMQQDFLKLQSFTTYLEIFQMLLQWKKNIFTSRLVLASSESNYQTAWFNLILNNEDNNENMGAFLDKCKDKYLAKAEIIPKEFSEEFYKESSEEYSEELSKYLKTLVTDAGVPVIEETLKQLQALLDHDAKVTLTKAGNYSDSFWKIIGDIKTSIVSVLPTVSIPLNIIYFSTKFCDGIEYTANTSISIGLNMYATGSTQWQMIKPSLLSLSTTFKHYYPAVVTAVSFLIENMKKDPIPWMFFAMALPLAAKGICAKQNVNSTHRLNL